MLEEEFNEWLRVVGAVAEVVVDSVGEACRGVFHCGLRSWAGVHDGERGLYFL